MSTSSAVPGDGSIRVIVLSTLLRMAFPPLAISSIPKRAIGFSFPPGVEGKLIGGALLGGAVLIGFLLSTIIGPVGWAITAWTMGGTAVLMLYNAAGGRLVFVKGYCSRCRLRPIIEFHERMHLDGEAHERPVWVETRKRYSYEGLALAADPKICSFCPIARNLRET